MSVRRQRMQRSQAKQKDLLADLRGQIVSGTLPPGSRFPNRAEIKDSYGVANDTIQWSFDRLIRDGFVVARRGHGSFVAQQPPHLFDYGIAFWTNPRDGLYWRRFDAALAQAADTVGHDGLHRFKPYHNLGTPAPSADFERLSEDIREHRLAGMVYTGEFAAAEALLASSQPRTPGVFLAGPPQKPRSVPTVYVDHSSFFRRALDYLSRRGRRRVAILTVTGGFWQQHETEVCEMAGQFGLTMQPYWQIQISPAGAEGARGCMHLLMHPGQTEVPDGLIVTDDNLAGHALAGLMAAGVRISHDLDVVTHWNFPLEGTNGLPVCRLGFDAHTALQMCIDLLRQQRDGLPPEPTTHLVPAVFEDEQQAGSMGIVGRNY